MTEMTLDRLSSSSSSESLALTNPSPPPQEPDPSVVTAATVAKRIFAMIGSIIAGAMMGALMTLQLLPLWPAVAVITAIALLALTYSTVVIFCTNAFRETPFLSIFPKRESLPHPGTVPPFQKSSSDTVYDRILTASQEVMQEKIKRVLHYFPWLKEEDEDLACYIKRLSTPLAKQHSCRMFKVYCQDTVAIQAFTNDLQAALWGSYAETVMNFLLERYDLPGIEFSCLNEAANTPIDSESIPESVQSVQQLAQETLLSTTEAIKAHQEKLQRVLHHLPWLKSDEEEIEVYLQRTSGNRSQIQEIACTQSRSALLKSPSSNDIHLDIVDAVLLELWQAYSQSITENSDLVKQLQEQSLWPNCLEDAANTPIDAESIPESIQRANAQLQQ